MNNEINPQKMREGIEKRKQQMKDLQYWIETREGYRLQMNFCIPGSPDHSCITISGCMAPKLAAVAINYLEKQIASMERKLSNVEQI